MKKALPSFSLAVLLVPLVSAEAPPLSPLLAERARLVLASGAGVALAHKATSRGPPPPLREVLGAREEATLVEEAPPNAVALLMRGLALFLLFLPIFLTAPLAALIKPFRTRVWFWLIKGCLASAGTAFIKWGQWAACRPDMFPELLCAQLAELHSKAPVHSYAHTRREVEEALGGPIGDIFESFDEVPLASGSIAQIHRATLRGEEVAVKVRHPNVVSRIVTDFALMALIADFTAKVPMLSWLNLKASVSQFSGTMVAQTRLDIEAEHLDRFNWNFGTRSWGDCAFPRVVRRFPSLPEAAKDGGAAESATESDAAAGDDRPRRERSESEVAKRAPPTRVVEPSRSVLVETYEPGVLVSKYTTEPTFGVGGQRLDRHRAHFIVSRGEDLYLKMLLLDNLMHADLHPGNILLDAVERTAYRIVLLDVGMVARLTPQESDAFIGLLHAIGAGDGRAASRAVLRFSSEPQEFCVSAEQIAAFSDDMHALFLQRCRGFGTDVKFGEVLRGVLALVRKQYAPHHTPVPTSRFDSTGARGAQPTREGVAGVAGAARVPSCLSRDPSLHLVTTSSPPLFRHRKLKLLSPLSPHLLSPVSSPLPLPHFLASRAPAQPSLDRGQLHDPRHERPMPRGDGRRAAARIQCPRRRAPAPDHPSLAAAPSLQGCHAAHSRSEAAAGCRVDGADASQEAGCGEPGAGRLGRRQPGHCRSVDTR